LVERIVGVAGVVLVHRIRGVAGIVLIDRVQWILRIVGVDRIQRIISTVLVERVEDIVVALVFLREAGLGKRRGEGEEQQEQKEKDNAHDEPRNKRQPLNSAYSPAGKKRKREEWSDTHIGPVLPERAP